MKPQHGSLVQRFVFDARALADLKLMLADSNTRMRARAFLSRWHTFGLALVPSVEVRDAVEELCIERQIEPVQMIEAVDERPELRGPLERWETEHPLGYDRPYATHLQTPAETKQWLADAVWLSARHDVHVLDPHAGSQCTRLVVALRALGELGFKSVTVQCLATHVKDSKEETATEASFDEFVAKLAQQLGATSLEREKRTEGAQRSASLDLRGASGQGHNGKLRSVTLLAHVRPEDKGFTLAESNTYEPPNKFHDRYLGIPDVAGTRLAANFGYGLLEQLKNSTKVPSIAVRLPGHMFDAHLAAIRGTSGGAEETGSG